MTGIPDTLEDAIVHARTAAQAAVADGLTRLQVELVFPELKIMPVAEQFLPAFENLGDRLRVFFPDPGSAALARRDWGEKPYPIRGVGELKAKIQPDEQMFIFIEPSAVEVAQVSQLCQEIQEKPVVLLNPRMEDIGAVGIGYAGRQLRKNFLNLFEPCYYLRPLEGAALLRCYPSPWQVWLEQEDGSYSLIAEQTQKPVGDALEQILMQATGTQPDAPPARKGLFAGLQQFIRALSQ
jgi:hypothetical protein